MSTDSDKIYQDFVMAKWNLKEICNKVGIKQLEEPYLRQS